MIYDARIARNRIRKQIVSKPFNKFQNFKYRTPKTFIIPVYVISWASSLKIIGVSFKCT